jgi:hypothetical protein
MHFGVSLAFLPSALSSLHLANFGWVFFTWPSVLHIPSLFFAPPSIHFSFSCDIYFNRDYLTSRDECLLHFLREQDLDFVSSNSIRSTISVGIDLRAVGVW